ncbi:MAG: DUF3787 domain-containing protein [Peptostreptococcaceae bacterium]
MKISQKPLTGKNNDRLYKHKPLNSGVNSAWNDIKSLKEESNVPIPSIEGVEESKAFVDEHEM